jgi:hypothetical protein
MIRERNLTKRPCAVCGCQPRDVHDDKIHSADRRQRAREQSRLQAEVLRKRARPR